jgi:hypothetical protein
MALFGKVSIEGATHPQATKGCPKRRSRRFWYGLVVVFFLALFPRLFYPVSRPMQWYSRSVGFWDALLEGDLRGTYQRYHPGVTTMWIAGMGLRIYALAHGWSADELMDPPLTPAGVKHYPIEAGVVALGVVISLCVCLVYVLLVQLLGWRTGIVGGCLLALDPLYLAYGKVLHVDAMLATLMLPSALFLIRYLRGKRRRLGQGHLHLLLSGAFAGLALLTKSPAGFLLPFAVLATAFCHLKDEWPASGGALKKLAWGRWLWRVAGDLGLWGLAAVCVFVLLWPAMWVMPEEILSTMWQRIVFHVETAHRNPNFFAGQVIDGDVGPLFYLATIAWKTTLVTLPALLATVPFLLRRAKQGRDAGPVWWVWVYAAAFTGAMMLAARKEIRYLLPTFPALDVLAAWGLVQVASSRTAASAIGRWKRLQEWTWVPAAGGRTAAILVAALVVQAGTVLRHHPYYSAHHNLLLGGSRVAQHILPLGEQGEGVELAARFLASYPGVERTTVGLQRRFIALFRRNFAGYTQSIEQSNVAYRVFAINANQRELEVERWGKFWEAYQQEEPLWSASFDGVPYVWIYRAYPHDPEAFAIDPRLDVQLGEAVRLLGYRLSASEIEAGDELSVTLFWQSDGRLAVDGHVFVHLLNPEGELVAQHDGVPVQGERPAWSFRDAEVLQDEHTVVTHLDLPAGTYTLSVGMYDFSTGIRLPAIGPTGERLPEDRIVLEDVQVTRP